MQKMKLYLVVEYDVPDKIGESPDIIVQAHKHVFEEEPMDFLQYIMKNETSTMEYEFSHGDSNGENPDDEFFNCSMYYYDKGPGSLCLKYGALCSNILCKQLN